MNEAQEIFCDGAAMAYRDCAKLIRGIIERAPPETKDFMKFLDVIAVACEIKSQSVYQECDKFTGVRQ